MRTIVLLPAALIVISACGQKNEEIVPKKVEEAFLKQFPNGDKVEWSKESDTEWEVDFKLEDVKYSAVFEQNGNWIETEHEIKAKQLPDLVKMTMEQHFSAYEIESAEIAEKEHGTFYELEIEKGEVMMEVVLNEDGSIVSKEKISEKDED